MYASSITRCTHLQSHDVCIFNHTMYASSITRCTHLQSHTVCIDHVMYAYRRDLWCLYFLLNICTNDARTWTTDSVGGSIIIICINPFHMDRKCRSNPWSLNPDWVHIVLRGQTLSSASAIALHNSGSGERVWPTRLGFTRFTHAAAGGVVDKAIGTATQTPE